MRIRKMWFVFSLVLFLSVFLFIYFGQYKFIKIKSSSGKSVGLWLTSQFLLNKDLDAISKKFGINFQEKQKEFKISFVDKSQANIQFSNSGIYYKCFDEVRYNHINIFIEKNIIKNKNMASNLYLILLKCPLVEMNKNSHDYIDLMNHLMRISSEKNIFKSLFIPLGR